MKAHEIPPYPGPGILVAWNTFNAHGGRTTHHAILEEGTGTDEVGREVHTHHCLLETAKGWTSVVEADWRHEFGTHRFRRQDLHLVTALGRPVYCAHDHPTPPESYD